MHKSSVLIWLTNFIDSDLHDIIVDNYNLGLNPDKENEVELEFYEFPTLPLDTALINNCCVSSSY